MNYTKSSWFSFSLKWQWGLPFLYRILERNEQHHGSQLFCKCQGSTPVSGVVLMVGSHHLPTDFWNLLLCSLCWIKDITLVHDLQAENMSHCYSSLHQSIHHPFQLGLNTVYQAVSLLLSTPIQSFGRPHYFLDRLLADLPSLLQFLAKNGWNSFLQILISIRWQTNSWGWHSKPSTVLGFPSMPILYVFMGSSGNLSPHLPSIRASTVQRFCLNSNYPVILGCLCPSTT